MKTLPCSLLRFCLLLFSLMLSAALWAQDQSSGGSTSGTNSSTSTTTTATHSSSANTDWYTQPWVWVVAGAVFILLLVALLNGGKSRNSVTTKRTVIRDTKS